jgi:hypothetical protein
MRDYKIGELTVSLMENQSDINDGRYQVVHGLMDMIYSCVERPDPFRYCQNMRKAINENNTAAVYECFFNFETSLTLAQGKDKNVWAQIFALITVEDGENQHDKTTWDLNYLSKKLDRYYAAGLTTGMIEKEVEGFFLTCPRLREAWVTQVELMNVLKLLGRLDFSTAKDVGVPITENSTELKTRSKNSKGN